MITFEDAYIKAQAISGDSGASALVQLKQDINIGYHRFNAAIARYFTRKQAFTDIVVGQQYYQTPIDSVRVMAVSTVLSNNYEFPVDQMRSEYQWRQQNIVPFTSTYAIYYFVVGNDQIGLWPIPSQTVSSGLRFIYQPQDVDMTQDDYTTGTITVVNGSTAVTGVGTTWTTNMIGSQITATDNSDGQWYEIIDVPTTTSLTLKTAWIGPSGATKPYRIGQIFIFPPEYDDVPIDYALARYFESKNNVVRAKYHRDNFDEQVNRAVREYASSSTSNVITGEMESINLWLVPPQVGV